MSVRHRPPATRRLVTLVALSLGLVSLAAAPASARTTPGTHGHVRAATAQADVVAAYAEYETARQRVSLISAQVDRLAGTAEDAAAVAGDLRAQVAHARGGFLHAVGDLVDPGESDLDRAAEAAVDAAHADQLAATARAALAEEIAETERARGRWEAAQRRQEAIEAKWTARQVADAAIERSQLPPAYDVAQPAQDDRNRRALADWEEHLNRLGTLAVVPPPAEELLDPDRLPAPLERVRTSRDETVPGVGQVSSAAHGPVTVLPVETVRAVSDAFHRLGLAGPPATATAAAYACGGLAAQAWGAARVTLPADSAAQWQELRDVPRRSWQIGDLVVLGGRASGLDRTGLYVGDRRVIVADAATGVAGVQVLPARGVLGVRRATLPAGVPRAGLPAGGPCDPAVASGTPADGTGPLEVPLAAGSYRVSAEYGIAGARWSTGEHTGQDLGAPTGTPVVSAGAGVVSVERPGWAGNLVRIDHGGGVETWYAHLADVDVTEGQTVGRGQRIGTVGALGNTTGPHLHFEVRLDGSAVDPTEVLDLPGHPRTAYPNGEAPLSVLCPATADGSQLLRCDAAVALRLLAAAFELGTGEPLCVTDSYRSRLGQEKVSVLKPHLAAVPGTSVHGWGLAVDLCGGVERFGTTQNTWLLAHAPAYGWTHPAWAGSGGSRPEPWHFEYGD